MSKPTSEEIDSVARLMTAVGGQGASPRTIYVGDPERLGAGLRELDPGRFLFCPCGATFDSTVHPKLKETGRCWECCFPGFRFAGDPDAEKAP